MNQDEAEATRLQDAIADAWTAYERARTDDKPRAEAAVEHAIEAAVRAEVEGEQAARIAELEHENEQFRVMFQTEYRIAAIESGLEARATAAESRLEGLEAAARRLTHGQNYGEHTSLCHVDSGEACTCYLDELWAAVEEASVEGRETS